MKSAFDSNPHVVNPHRNEKKAYITKQQTALSKKTPLSEEFHSLFHTNVVYHIQYNIQDSIGKVPSQVQTKINLKKSL